MALRSQIVLSKKTCWWRRRWWKDSTSAPTLMSWSWYQESGLPRCNLTYEGSYHTTHISQITSVSYKHPSNIPHRRPSLIYMTYFDPTCFSLQRSVIIIHYSVLLRAQRISFFISGGFGSGIKEKSGTVEGGFWSGRSVETFNQLFPCTLSTLLCFLVLYLRLGISGYYGYYLSFGGIEPNEYGVLYLKYSLRSRYTRNFWVYPTFRVSWYPIIFKTETGQVEFAKKVKWRTGIRNLEVFRPKMLIGKCPKFSLF